MEVDRAEDSFVAHHSPPSVVTKVGIKLEDMGMGGNKRTVFFNKNKKLVEIQVQLNPLNGSSDNGSINHY